VFIILLTLLSAPISDWSYDKSMSVGDLVVSRFNNEMAIYQVLATHPKHKHNKACTISDVLQKNPVFVLKRIFDSQFNFVVGENKILELDAFWLSKLDHKFIEERIKRLQFVKDFLDD
jgi:hypothetical protein